MKSQAFLGPKVHQNQKIQKSLNSSIKSASLPGVPIRSRKSSSGCQQLIREHWPAPLSQVPGGYVPGVHVFWKTCRFKDKKNSPEKADISLSLSKNYSSMSVDIGTYRARIGLFQSVNCNQKKPKYKLSRCKIPKWNISTFFFFWCLSSAITNPPVPIRHQIPDMTPQFRTFSMVPHVSANQDYLSPIWQ